MSQEERHGTRDRAYSVWHRRNSTRRFVGPGKAELLAMIDVDATLWVEFNLESKKPLALIETALDVGQAYKPTTVLQGLASMCSPTIPAFIVLYSLSDKPNPADPNERDIARFRVRQIWPQPDRRWRTMTPHRWARTLLAIRNEYLPLWRPELAGGSYKPVTLEWFEQLEMIEKSAAESMV